MDIIDDKLRENIKEVKKINNKLRELSEKILNEFGPEGAYNMACILQELAEKDIEKGMKER